MPGLTLICGGGQPPQTMGDVIVKANVVAGDYCPLLTQWEASPLQTTSGQPIAVSVTATDSDNPTLTYTWTTSSGSFVNAAAASTNYLCGAPGDQTVTITVSDGTVACNKSVTFAVHCVAAGVCNNGILEPGEQCDPSNGTNCINCQHVVFCGDGVTEGTEQCDPPSAANHCSATCQRIPFCGDNIITPPETCDPPNGGSCGPTCQSVVVCPGTTPPLDQCLVCEKADTNNCLPSLTVVPGGYGGCFGCDGFAPGSNGQVHCAALLSCIRTQHCSSGDDPTPCLCGSLSAGSCVSMGAPATAPCAAQYAAAAADAPGTVFTQFGLPTAPVGIANNVAACRIDSMCPTCQ